MIRGEDVVVLRRRKVGTDPLNAPAFGPWEPEAEPVCALVAPGATADLEASRPAGAVVALTLHFPKSYTAPLKGCMVRARGRDWRVVGDPQPYASVNVPGPWNRPVEVEAVDG